MSDPMLRICLLAFVLHFIRSEMPSGNNTETTMMKENRMSDLEHLHMANDTDFSDNMQPKEMPKDSMKARKGDNGMEQSESAYPSAGDFRMIANAKRRMSRSPFKPAYQPMSLYTGLYPGAYPPMFYLAKPGMMMTTMAPATTTTTTAAPTTTKGQKYSGYFYFG